MRNRKFRVAMIGHKRIPTREGGVEIVVEELAARMAERGIEVEAFNRRDIGVSEQSKLPKEYKGVRIINIPTFRQSALNAFVYSVLASIRALFGRYDCLHYHAEGPCAMIWLPKLFGRRVIATIHGLDWQRAKWGGFSTWYIKQGEKAAVKFADEIIVLSENNRKYFLDHYNRETRFIPNGMKMKEQSYPPKRIREKFGLERDGYILFLARIVPEKGLHYLIEAFGNIKTDKKLVIAGGLTQGSEYVEKIKKMAERDDRIILAGFVQGEMLDELFDNCMVYVLPSDIEGMAMSLLECISYRTPCLVSDIPENLEVVGGYMPSFKHGSAESLRRELEKVIGGSLKNVDTGCYEQILRRYDWEDIVTRTIALYEKRK